MQSTKYHQVLVAVASALMLCAMSLLVYDAAERGPIDVQALIGAPTR